MIRILYYNYLAHERPGTRVHRHVSGEVVVGVEHFAAVSAGEGLVARRGPRGGRRERGRGRVGRRRRGWWLSVLPERRRLGGHQARYRELQLRHLALPTRAERLHADLLCSENIIQISSVLK